MNKTNILASNKKLQELRKINYLYLIQNDLISKSFIEKIFKIKE